jgi:protein-disulfide isomerase
MISKNGLLNAATAIATVCAVAVAGYRLKEALSKPADARFREVRNWKDFSARGHRDGPVDAKVTVVDFSDYQCPFCRRASTYLHGLVARYPREVSVVYRHFPIHEFAAEAAEVAECSGEQGKFDAMHESLFAQPDSIGLKPWVRFAKDAGVRDLARFQSCLSNERFRAAVIADSTAGGELGITGTPTLLINEVRVRGFLGESTLDSIVRARLKP